MLPHLVKSWLAAPLPRPHSEAAYQHQQSSFELVDAAAPGKSWLAAPHSQGLISPKRIKLDAMQIAVISMQHNAWEAAYQHQQSSFELMDADAPG